MSTTSYEGWAIVELMGHRRLAGRVSEVTQYGCAMMRLDIPIAPKADDPRTYETQFYGSAAIYAVTPTTEEIATELAKQSRHAPVQRWELPQLAAPEDHDPMADDDVDYDDDDDGDPGF